MRPGSLAARVLALSTLVVIGLGVWVFVILPILDWRRDIAAATQRNSQQIERHVASIEDLSSEQAQLQATSIDPFLWTAREQGAATARVQERISQLASENGVSIRAITPTGAREIPSADAVSFRLEIEASLDQLTPFLAGVEEHTPALAIERADLRRLARPGPPPMQPILFAQLEILAPIRIDAEADE